MDLPTRNDGAAPDSGASVPSSSVGSGRWRKVFEPRIHAESSYDRISSMLMALVIGTSIVVGWLCLIKLTTKAYATSIRPPIELLDVFSREGGDPEGELAGPAGTNEIPDKVPSDLSTNTVENAGEFGDPTAQPAQSIVLDPLSAISNEAGEGTDFSTALNRTESGISSGTPLTSKARGIRRLGTGFALGTGGETREARWVFEFAEGQDESDYAKMLDFFGIELGTPVGNNTIAYASQFSTAPQTRTGLSRIETRMYTSWLGSARKRFDVQLLTKAGVKATEKSIILQFLPTAFEETLLRLEHEYKRRPPAEIRLTRFKIVSSGNTFDLRVISQDYLK